MTNNLKTGKDSVVIGRVSGEVGEGSVVIGPTDDQGNTVINQSMAVGRGAMAGSNSIAIGAGASAGNDIFELLQRLRSIPEVELDKTLVETVDRLVDELKKPEPEAGTIRVLWSIVQGAAAVSGAVSLVQAIGTILLG